MPDLLAIIVERWKTGFKGISALEIRDILGISHEDAIAQLRALKADGAIALRECRLGEPSKFNEMSMAGVSIKVPSEWEMVDTLMAVPSLRTTVAVWAQRNEVLARAYASLSFGATATRWSGRRIVRETNPAASNTVADR